MKELKVKVTKNKENKVLSIEPLNKVKGDEGETEIMTARLLTEEDEDRELRATRKLMQEGCHTYERHNRRIRQKS